ncbi:MAG: MBOAT family protein [Hyphomonadaceae bacterium]|nr:MBOAT family protein [Hyphomonadaceae bacterium]
MLFNSYEFILLFLPITLAVFFALGALSRSAALGWLILASVVFYAWWRPFNLWIIGPSLAVNYALASVIVRLAAAGSRPHLKSALVAIGILFNVCLLGYFKYANFAVSIANDVTGAHFSFEQIILPLGISFITFQKIAFLIDVSAGRIKSFSLRDYLLFVMFFPQLIAGPIVHFREMAPQFETLRARFDATLFALGITLFSFGLFKKVVLADSVAEAVSPVFAYAAAGEQATLVQSWFAAIGFTFQIYFDFSGYSDMACGAALLFGMRLPMNFDSPLRASNIIDFWLRWHVTLTRFLTAYVYNPLALSIARRRAAAGKPALGARGSKLLAFVSVLALPTMATMLLSGVWHGAGYTFILWGALHGAYLIANHLWRQYGSKTHGKRMSWIESLAGFVVTLLAVVFAMVLFRAPDLGTAGNIFAGMLGMHGFGLPLGLATALGAPNLGPMLGLAGDVPLSTFAFSLATLAGVVAVALFTPDSLQVLSRYQPTLTLPKQPPKLLLVGPELHWAPTLPWLLVTVALIGASMVKLTGRSEFLYWQF